jgi:hypothetical protein
MSCVLVVLNNEYFECSWKCSDDGTELEMGG